MMKGIIQGLAALLSLAPMLHCTQPSRSMGAYEEPTYDAAALAASIVYPADALERNIRGDVVAEFFIDADGEARSAGWLATDRLLADAAAHLLSPLVLMRAARLDGEPIGSWMRIRITFYRDEDGVGRARITDTSAPRNQVASMSDEPMELIATGRMPAYDHSELRAHATYPSEATADGATEIVRVLARIDERGKLFHAEALDGREELKEAALKAVMRTLFTPAIMNGHPIVMPIIIPVSLTPAFPVDPHGAPPADEADTFGTPSRESEDEDYDVFVPAETPAGYDKSELQRNIVYPDGVDVTPGTVYVRARIDKRGRVTTVRIDKGLTPALDSAAVDAVRRTRFAPAIQNGEPITMTMTIPVLFKLEDVAPFD